MPTLLTPHFTLEELSTTSHTSLAKEQTQLAREMPIAGKLYTVAATLLEPLRALHGGPLRVNSGFRSPAVNAAVGGAKTSQHQVGEAADITTGDAAANKRLFEAAQALALNAGIRFGQLILETPPGKSWIHVSLGAPWRRAEGQVMLFNGSKYTLVRTITYKGA